MPRIAPADRFGVTPSSALSTTERTRVTPVLCEYVSAAIRNQAPYFMEVRAVEIIAVHDRSDVRPPRYGQGVEYLVEARLSSGALVSSEEEIATASGGRRLPAEVDPRFPVVFSLEYWESGPSEGAIVTGLTAYIGQRAFAVGDLDVARGFLREKRLALGARARTAEAAGRPGTAAGPVVARDLS